MSWTETALPAPAGTRSLRVVCGIVNMIVPGLGLFILTISSKPFQRNTAIISFCQFITLFIVVGFVWAWINSFRIFYIADRNRDGKNVMAPDADEAQTPPEQAQARPQPAA